MTVNEITSRQNAKFKTWLSLLETRGIKKQGQALLSGKKLVEEFLAYSPEHARELLAPSQVSASSGIASYVLDKPLFKELDILGTNSPLLVVDTPEVGQFTSGQPPSGLELVVALSDPGNLGAVLRSAEAFSAKRVILTEECASPFLPKSLRASSGSAFRIPLVRTGPLADLQLAHAMCLDMEGESIVDLKWPHDLYLVLGEEGRGIPQNFAARRIRIPMSGDLESLNALAAASVALFSYHCAHTRQTVQL